MCQIVTDGSLKELNESLDVRFPFKITREDYANYYHHYFRAHWHPEIEIHLLMEGESFFTIQNRDYYLKAGEGLFINQNILHLGRVTEKDLCRSIVIRMEPYFLDRDQKGIVYQKYVKPVIESRKLEQLRLSGVVPWQKQWMKDFLEIADLFDEKADGYELEIQGRVSKLWKEFYLQTKHLQHIPLPENKDTEKMKMALSFIEENYEKKITLAQIAHACGTCQSECCRIFQEILKTSPMEYVNTVRIQNSLNALKNKKKSITEIAYQSGFSSASYYAEVFRKKMGCTPGQYRKK